MALYIPESIIIRLDLNSIHGQYKDKAIQMFLPSSIVIKWDGQRSILTQSSNTLLPITRTYLKKLIRDLQYSTVIALRLEGLGSRFEKVDDQRIIFKLGRSHSYYLQLPSPWKIEFLTPRVCLFSGPNSIEVPQLIEIIKRYKKLDRSHGFLSSSISIPLLPKK